MFSEASYSPHRFDFEITIDARELSPMAGYVYQLAHEDQARQGEMSIFDLYRTPMHEDSLTFDTFLRLELHEQTELMTFYTRPLHEARHHIDFVSTPFGVRFYTLLAEEYLCFQRASPYLLGHQDVISPGPLRKLHDRLEKAGREVPPEWRQAWTQFLAVLSRLQATTDTRGLEARADEVVPNPDLELTLCGMTFREVRVSETSRSYELKDRPGWYMRSATLLEGRAVAESLLWMIHTLGECDGLGQILAAYVEENYPNTAPADYRFVLDLAASWLGEPSIEEALRKRLPIEIRSALHLIDNAAWFALHGGYHQQDLGWAPENIFTRFLFALRTLEAAVAARVETTPYATLADVEASALASQFGILPTDRAMTTALSVLRASRATALPELWQSDMAGHFERVYGVLEEVLVHREGSGLAFQAGAPADGNCLLALDGAVAATCLTRYDPSTWVDQWFDFRNRAMFTPSTTNMTLTYLRRQFGLAEVLFPCECGGLVSFEVPRWKDVYDLTCPHCSRAYHERREDMLTIEDVP